MTLACGGGPSQLKPGAAQNVIFSAALITAGLEIISPWLLPLAALADTFVYTALNQCQGDPPAMPSSADLNPLHAVGGLINPNFQAWKTAVRNLLLNWAWTAYCQCVTGSATPPVYPAQPSGVGGSSGTGGVACFQGQFSGTPTQETSPTALRPSTWSLMPAGNVVNWPFGAGQTAQTVLIPAASYTSINFTGVVTFDAAGTKQYSAECNFFDSTGTFISNPFHNTAWNASPQSLNFNIAIPATAAYIGVESGQVDEPHPCSLTLVATWSCAAGGATAGPCQPCTDPAVLEVLNTIHQLAEAIYLALPVLPHSFSEGTVHGGLSGAGTISIASSAIALKVSITTDLPGGRIDLGSPNYLFDRGYIVPITSEAPIRGITRLVYNPQLFMVPNLTEQIGYTFPTGEVVTITEVLRGP